MKLHVKHQAGAIDTRISCNVEWCNSQGVAFSLLADSDKSPISELESLSFRVHESHAFPGIFICPWESSDGGDCYLCFL